MRHLLLSVGLLPGLVVAQTTLPDIDVTVRMSCRTPLQVAPGGFPQEPMITKLRGSQLTTAPLTLTLISPWTDSYGSVDMHFIVQGSGQVVGYRAYATPSPATEIKPSSIAASAAAIPPTPIVNHSAARAMALLRLCTFDALPAAVPVLQYVVPVRVHLKADPSAGPSDGISFEDTRSTSLPQPRLKPDSCSRADYPLKARRAEAQGITRVQFDVLDTGEVMGLELARQSGGSREHRQLDDLALATMRTCEFSPTRPDSQRRAFRISMEVIWRLEPRPPIVPP